MPTSLGEDGVQIIQATKMPLNEKMKFVQKMVFMSSRPMFYRKTSSPIQTVRQQYWYGRLCNDLLTLCEADITTKTPSDLPVENFN